jgi:putative SOS response-associated peptidase YedK
MSSVRNDGAKQWICNRPDDEPVAIAVIFNAWESVQGPLRAFAMVTTESCKPLGNKDGRMSVLLASDEEVATWLDEFGVTDAELKALLRPYEGELVMREQDGPKPRGDKSPPKPKKARPDPQPKSF